jgi:hypothetical protein
MQLLLTKPELQLLADLLEQKRYALTHSPQPATDRELRLAHGYEELLGRVIDHDIHFGADELCTLSDLLNECDLEFKRSGVSGEKRDQLESMLDKFVEASAMV